MDFFSFFVFKFCFFPPISLAIGLTLSTIKSPRSKCGFCRWSAPKLRGYQQNAQMFSKPVGMRWQRFAAKRCFQRHGDVAVTWDVKTWYCFNESKRWKHEGKAADIHHLSIHRSIHHMGKHFLLSFIHHPLYHPSMDSHPLWGGHRLHCQDIAWALGDGRNEQQQQTTTTTTTTTNNHNDHDHDHDHDHHHDHENGCYY